METKEIVDSIEKLEDIIDRVKEAQKEFEKQEPTKCKDDGYDFKVCMRMSGKRLKEDLPFLSYVNDEAFVTVYTYYKRSK